MEDNNLFTDIYSLKKEIYGINPFSEMRKMREEIEEDIFENRVPKKIRYILFKMTNYCNSDCEYCTHALNRQPREAKFTIPKDVIMRTIEEASDMGVDAISISGGEPLLRTDITEVIKKIVDYGIIPVLLTNGLLLEEKWESLGEAGLRYIIISFDSVTPEIYEKQRGADFERALSGIEAAIKLRNRYPEAEIHVSAVLTKDNQDDFIKLLDFMNEKKIKVQISPYHKRKDDMDDYSIYERDKIQKLSEKLIQMKESGWSIANSIGFIKHLPDFFCGGKVMPDDFKCKVGYTNLAIDAYMNVKPCWSFMYESMGNLSEKTLTEIWNSDVMKSNRMKMLNCKCEGCWYLCTSEVCLMLDTILS